jgi:thiamine biosynthesis lipoprotein
MSFRTAVVAVWLLSACGGAAPPEAPPARLVEDARVTMGSELRLTAWTAHQETAAGAFEEVFAEFERLDGLLSVWRDGSDVQRVNAAAGEKPVTVSRETIELLAVARQVSEWTEGKFDITFGALADVWKFDHDQDSRVPTQEEIRARLPLVDYRAVEVDEQAGTVFLTRKGVRIHLGGIGKGYAIDRSVEILRSRGLRDFMIQAGGDLYVAGQRDGRPWRVGIHDPRGTEPFAYIDLTDATFSTSGDYERFFMHGGRRYHHIIDPDVGEPAAGSRSVTVRTTRATLADAIDTGVFVLGPEKGMALVEKLPDVEAVIVTSGNQVLISSGLQGRVTLLRQPTDAP